MVPATSAVVAGLIATSSPPISHEYHSSHAVPGLAFVRIAAGWRCPCCGGDRELLPGDVERQGAAIALTCSLCGAAPLAFRLAEEAQR